MKTQLITLFSSTLLLSACTSYKPLITNSSQCTGDLSPPSQLSSNLKPINDKKKHHKAIKEPLSGALCQGRTYQVVKHFTIYRLWNSTNNNSQLGHWWVFDKPQGLISDYRANYGICYQWSPLDRLVSCTITEGATLIIGTGQSIKCSEYLQYPTSNYKQIYINQNTLKKKLINCTTEKAYFNWSE
ncbi:hypothetical protein L3V83_12775 [Thiotrichales bacterium 19X7-9]|nr:hypothetical protein [Thiotrichales bacterium 19X7-9]